jgi:hypothetical protein
VTDYLTPIEVAIHADHFISGLYAENDFSFKRLAHWLRGNTEPLGK